MGESSTPSRANCVNELFLYSCLLDYCRCVRLGNPDLHFGIRIWILQSNAKSENGFHLREIRPRGGFQLRNPNPDFMDFLFTVRLRNPKKDL